jgi:hypothetical protein
MDSNTSKDEKHVRKQRSNRMKIFLPLIIIAVLAIILYVKLNDSPKKSTVDGVSDEVYEQLVQFYFFTTTFMDFYLEDELSETEEWMEGHELYEQAEEYAKDHDVPHVMSVYPNPLFEKYRKNPDNYSETEQEYIEKMIAYLRTFQRLDMEEHEVLKKELKEELQIKDSYNPF